MSKYRNNIIIGDVLDPATWAGIPDGHVQTCITSPPYWGLRDYGTATWEGGDPECDHCVDRFATAVSEKQASNAASGSKQARDTCPKCGARRIDAQLGLEATPEEFIERMVEVFRHVRRVLRDDGTLWLNMGDSYNAQTGKGFPGTGQVRLDENSRNARRKRPPGLKPKDLCGIPWRLALALQADGWYLRQDIIWAKPNPMPESCTDRCTKAHEYIFLLTKKPRYFCDMEAIKETCNYPEGSWGRSRCYDDDETGKLRSFYGNGSQWKGGATRNKRSVWTVPTAPYSEAHFATFPPELIRPCVLAGTSAKGACPECGAPWVRVVEVQDPEGRLGSGYHNHKDDLARGQRGVFAADGAPTRQTVGWEPGCACEREAELIHPDGTSTPCEPYTVPCIVFDPFMGSGTTGMVARQHDRDYLGIELNPDYAEMARHRIGANTEPGYTTAAAPADAPLFEEKE